MRNYFLLIGLVVLTACSSQSSHRKKAKGDVVFGGNATMMTHNSVASLLPFLTSSNDEKRINQQIFENLLQFNPNNQTVEPLLITAWRKENQGKTYVLTVRNDVFFHNDACFSAQQEQRLTADDIQFSLEMACAGFNNSPFSELLTSLIEGGNAFKKATKETIGNHRLSGIKVLDDKTLQLHLTHDFPLLDKLLCNTELVALSRKAYAMYGRDLNNHPIGTGAFHVKDWTAKKLMLSRFDQYWKKDQFGNTLPYLDQLTWKFNVPMDQQILAFKSGKTDLILDIQADEIEQIVGTLKEAQEGKNIKHNIVSAKSLKISFLTFNNYVKPFDNPLVRQAILLGINRQVLVNKCLKGSGELLTNGFLPSMYNFNGEAAPLIPFDIAQAKALLKAANFENGVNFPVIALYAVDENPLSIVILEEVKDQLKQHLNIEAHIIKGNARSSITNRIQPRISLRSLIASYPDASSYLYYFTGKYELREWQDFKINQAAFSQDLSLAFEEQSAEKRTNLYNRCDQLLIDEAFVVPLYNHDVISVINAKVRNYSIDNFEKVDFSTVFLRSVGN